MTNALGPQAVMIHGVPVKSYNALQNHIIVLLVLNTHAILAH